MRSYTLVCLIATFTTCWASLRAERHHISRSVNDPDDPRFSLMNLMSVFNAQLDRLQGRPNRDSTANPFAIRPICDFKSEFRTIDGTCNNIRDPRRGAAKTPLLRLSPNAYGDGINSARRTYFRSPGNLVTARNVSKGVFNKMSNLSVEHSHLMMGYGQFLDHDITISPEADGEGGVVETAERCCEVPESGHVDDLRECFPLDVTGDTVFRNLTCIPFLRSAPVPPPPSARFERFQLNDLTAYVDASNVYGTTLIKATALRSFINGKMKTSRGLNGEERLPLDPENPASCFSMISECRFLGGDVRNSEQAGLSSIHTLLIREHNRIAEELLRLNPHWRNLKNFDQKIYEVTRKIVGGILQRITYREFLPEVVGSAIISRYNLRLMDSGRFTGYNPNADASIVTEFSSAAFRFGHTMIRNLFGAGTRQVPLREIFSAFKVVDTYGATGLLNGLAQDATESFDSSFAEAIQDELFAQDLDLVALNIQRGRDHGVASYMDVRRRLGLRTFTQFNDMIGVTHSLANINNLRSVYPNPADIELFPGGISELTASDAIVGPVFARIIGVQFQRIKVGDRFWHETNDATVKFTDAQLAEIRKSSFAALYCDNVPGVQVRDFMLLIQSNRNPRKNCRDIPTLDLSAWAEDVSGPSPTTKSVQTTTPYYRPPTAAPRSVPVWCRYKWRFLSACRGRVYYP